MKNYRLQYFAKQERKSLLLLVSIIVATLSILYYVNKYDKPEIYAMDELIDTKKIKIEEEDLGKKVELKDEEEKSIKFSGKKFDPNTISIESLRAMGVDKFASSNLEKYRNKGGKIKSKEQFFKIYGMDKFRSKLENLIVLDTINKDINKSKNIAINDIDYQRGIEQSSGRKDKVYVKNFGVDSSSKVREEIPNKPMVKLKVVELNQADSFELESIYGIGAKLASRIVKYKDRLGGFYDIMQLEEVYGLRPEIYSSIVHLVRVDASGIKKIPINEVDELTLSRHPYLGRKSAAIIMRYKKNHGEFRNIEDLIKVKIFTEDDISRLKWYIDFNAK
jgi:competence protein ComEA